MSNPGSYAALSWGVVNGEVPAAAFDNDIDGLNFDVDPNPDEYMTYNPAGSDPMNGVAQWTGQAQIQLVVPFVSRTLIPTRFTLTVTDGGGVPLAFVGNEEPVPSTRRSHESGTRRKVDTADGSDESIDVLLDRVLGAG